MRYGNLELAYASAIADALVEFDEFRAWLLSKSKFRQSATTSHVLVEEMTARRGKTAQTWWRSHYTEKCRCSGCSGQETDILAIFEDGAAHRFAIHFEVKQPTDRFPSGKDQAENYRTRAACWVGNPPRAILPHTAAATCLLYAAAKQSDYGSNIAKFDFAVTFEEIRSAFPTIALPHGA